MEEIMDYFPPHFSEVLLSFFVCRCQWQMPQFLVQSPSKHGGSQLDFADLSSILHSTTSSTARGGGGGSRATEVWFL